VLSGRASGGVPGPQGGGMVGTWGEVGVLAPGGVEPAGRRGAASRRRSLGLMLVFAISAGTSGAALGLLRQPDPHEPFDALAWTTTAAIAALRNSEARVRTAEQALAAARARIIELSATGAPEEMADAREAERLGAARFIKSSAGFRDEDRRRVEAAILRESSRSVLDPLLVSAVIAAES